MFERLSTPRPAPKVTLKKRWIVQQLLQQQPICNEVVTSTSKVVAKWEESQSGTRDGTKRDVRSCIQLVREIAQGNLCKIRSQKVEQKPDVDIDLRVQGVSQDAILQDEENARNQPAGEQSKKLDQTRFLFATTWRKMAWYSVKNRAVLSVRWAMWS